MAKCCSRFKMLMMLSGFLLISVFIGNVVYTNMAFAVGNPNEDCPVGTTLVAKFNVDQSKDPCEYNFEKPQGNDRVVTITNADCDGGDWSSTVDICTIIVKGGSDADSQDLGSTSSGSFDNQGLPDAGQSGKPPEISNIQFCECDEPTVISLITFEAEVDSEKNVVLEWQTATEIDNAAFNIWRSDDDTGTFTKINENPIPAQGGETWGAEYSFTDTNVSADHVYHYLLEDVEYDGDSSLNGPLSVTVENNERRFRFRK